MSKSDRELFEEYDKEVEALKLCWKKNYEIEDIERNTFKEIHLVEMVEQDEKDKIRGSLLHEYEQSVIRYELEKKDKGDKIEFFRGQVEMIKGILWLYYQVSYEYKVGLSKEKE